MPVRITESETIMAQEDGVRFDDKLATVLAQPLADPAARAAAWRQIVDILAQGSDGRVDPLSDEAWDMVRALRAEVPAAIRADAARAIAGRRLPPSIVALIAQEPPAIAAPVLSGTALGADDWLGLLPGIPPAARALLRNRRDLPREVVRGLASFGSTDFVLHGALATPQAIAGEAPAAVRPQPDQLPSAPASATAPQGDTQIRDLIDRIAAYRRGERAADGDDARPAEADTPVTGFRFETGPDGVVLWVEGAPRGPLIGETIATAAGSVDHGVDGHAAGAYRRRAPFRDARLSVSGSGPVGGEWRISAVPFFDQRDGRFTGYRGTARRPRPGESAGPVGAAPAGLGIEPDSLRQLVHELRTPLNAIVGFGEMIERQMLGPAGHEYRARASDIVAEGRRLLAAVDDLDMAARVDGNRLARDPGPVDAATLLSRLHADYEGIAAARGAALAFRVAQDLPPVAADPVAVERMFARLLASAIGVAGTGETIAATLGRAPGGDGQISLLVVRPLALAGRDERTLLDPGYSPEGDWPDAPLLGLGFALRLVRSLAVNAGGGLDILAEAFLLQLPAAVDTARTEQA